MRAGVWLVVCAALALAAAHSHHQARLEHIKTQILAKLGLTSRPTPMGAPPKDVVRQILARAADPSPEPHHEPDAMREIIAIAHRVDAVIDPRSLTFSISLSLCENPVQHEEKKTHHRQATHTHMCESDIS